AGMPKSLHSQGQCDGDDNKAQGARLHGGSPHHSRPCLIFGQYSSSLNFGSLSPSWHFRQSYSTFATVSRSGAEYFASCGCSTCKLAGPWQFSHWLPLRCGVVSSVTKPVLSSKPVVWQRAHSGSCCRPTVSGGWSLRLIAASGRPYFSRLS